MSETKMVTVSLELLTKVVVAFQLTMAEGVRPEPETVSLRPEPPGAKADRLSG